MRGKVIEFLDSNLQKNFCIESSLEEQQKLRVEKEQAIMFLNQEVEYDMSYIPGRRSYGDPTDMKGWVANIRD